MSGDRAHWHLVKAIKKLDPGYAAVISTQITSAQLPASLPSAQLPASLPSAQLPASLPSINDTLSAFAQHYRRTYTNKSTIPSSAYAATLQGEESPYQRRKQSRCPCGDFHIWGACQSSWRLSSLEASHLIYGSKRILESFAKILKETRL
ncbi:hypothetical protein BCR34DRAFT_588458 [Clohesyomyces aquaticus]|uniref:Uncharacterized protein n=1 Tax=Clohesyomyces aquaticus TaxID=1231657 RepID=A0A1Y1ZKD4_9PLEO|nr:hypothetical protein BCR34DRAFT_588458 [Clohesyomyces aquaticus]